MLETTLKRIPDGAEMTIDEVVESSVSSRRHVCNLIRQTIYSNKPSFTLYDIQNNPTEFEVPGDIPLDWFGLGTEIGGLYDVP